MFRLNRTIRAFQHRPKRFYATNVPPVNVNEIVLKSQEAFSAYRTVGFFLISISPHQTKPIIVHNFLCSIADELENVSHTLIDTANRETRLPRARLEGELKRTTGQLRTFGQVADQGNWADPRIELVSRSMLVPLGPVAVFGASNFPFAFSTAGGDTASALAARCSVHPGHPKTSQITYEAIEKMRAVHRLPPNIFQLVEGDVPIAHELVAHPGIKAIGFTGSQKAGRHIIQTVNQREEPIPAYCEMGSVNPVFIFPGILHEKTHEIAQALCQSVVQGVGQFCTNPGLVFLIGEDDHVIEFISELTIAMSQIPPAPMLTPGIFESWLTGLELMKSYTDLGVSLEYATFSQEYEKGAGPALFSVSIQNFMKNAKLFQTELFGPSTLLVRCRSIKDVEGLSSVLEGQLSASFHGNEADKQLDGVPQLLSSISERVGRMLWGGFPTGVAVNASMQHGGPWPASSDSRTTSVGTRAILRWARPLCYQDFPNELLPPQIQD